MVNEKDLSLSCLPFHHPGILFSHNVKELYFKYRDKKLQNKKPEHFLCSGLDISFNNFLLSFIDIRT
jgi:hypothetical protein